MPSTISSKLLSSDVESSTFIIKLDKRPPVGILKVRLELLPKGNTVLIPDRVLDE